MTLIHERVESARKGDNPFVIRKANSGWIVIGDVQFLEGYCLLLADPVVSSLNDLTKKQRKEFLYEMSVVGDVLLEVTGCYLVNYEILGNSEKALHAHIFPRFLDEPVERRRMPAWFYDWKNAPKFSPEKHNNLKDRIKQALKMQFDRDC